MRGTSSVHLGHLYCVLRSVAAKRHETRELSLELAIAAGVQHIELAFVQAARLLNTCNSTFFAAVRFRRHSGVA